MHGWYFYTGVLGFVLGVGIASVYDIGFAYVAWVVTLAGGVWMLARRKGFALPSRKLFLLPLLLLAIALGVIRFNLATFDVVNPLYEIQIGSPVFLEGIVAREPDIRENTAHLYVRVDDELFLVKTNRYVDIEYGDRVAVQGILRKPEAFETDLGRTFKYPQYLHARGVSYTVGFAHIKVVENNQGNIFIAKILQWKQLFMRSIENVLPEPQVGLAEGLLLGVKQALGDELEAVFRKTGIIHIVVLSGYNVMLVVIFITYVLSYVLPFRARIWFGIGSIICFAILVGLSATVVRASIMAGLTLVARNMGRSYTVVRALLFAGLIMILINPYLLVFDVGFQLSFLATLGLIFFAPFIERIVTFMPTFFQIREFFTATIATQIFVLPILLYSIGEFSIVSVVVNVLVLPMVPVAMLFTFITGIVGLFSMQLATLLGYLTYISLNYILVIATFFAQIPFASFTVQVFPFWVVLVSYMFMGYVLYRLYTAPDVKLSLPRLVDEIDEVESWVLEDEEELKQKLAAESQSDSAVSKLPTFFR